MGLRIATCSKKQLHSWLTTTHIAFGDELRQTEYERHSALIAPERAHAAFEGDEIVGSAGAYSFRLTVPGNEVDAAGVTMVGVLPSHRRRGILRGLMEAQFDDIKKRGESIAVLFASEESIYQRFGYGLAANQARIDIEKDRATFLTKPEPIGRMRMVSHDEALKTMPSVYDVVRRQRPGMFVRSQEWWQHERLFDDPHWRRGGGPLFYAVLEIDGNAEGYALYRLRQDWREGVPAGKLEVKEAMGTTPEATKAVWAYLFGVDLVERIDCYYLPSDWPIFLMLAEPRRLRFRFAESLWLRVVDVPSALEARRYDADGRVMVGITDRTCEWNEGTWSLEIEGSRARVQRTDADPEISLDINALGAIYLGEYSFSDLAAAGRAQELRDGALERADRSFRTSVKPWSPQNF